MPSLVRRAVALAFTALVLYGVAPAIGEVLGAWPKVAELKPWWLVAMLLFEAASCWCLWELQALSIGTRDTTAVATSQLAGGALGRVIPGGAATAAATQYNMLSTADVPRAAIATGLAAATVLQIAALCVLPAVALPVLLFGFTVPETLLETAILALGLFLAMLGLGIGVARSEGTLKAVGRFAVRVSARLPGDRALSQEFPERLVVQRDEVVERLGDRFLRACAAAVGRWVFDLLALATAIQAVGATPRFSLVLLAYVTAQLLAQIPITPGGIGVVEAGLTATLALAGVRGGDAAVAVLAYRLVSYWLMLPAGLIAWIVHRRRLSVSAAT